MAPVVWKYPTMGNGEQFVTTFGVLETLKLHVVNLDTSTLSELFEATKFNMELDRYGWTTLVAMVTKRRWPVVIIGDLEFITVTIVTTQE